MAENRARCEANAKKYEAMKQRLEVAESTVPEVREPVAESVAVPVVPESSDESVSRSRVSTPKPGVTLAPIFAAAAGDISATSESSDGEAEVETEEERARKELCKRRVARFGRLPGCSVVREGPSEKAKVLNLCFSLSLIFF